MFPQGKERHVDFKFSVAAINLIESHFAINPDFRPVKGKPVEISWRLNIACKHEEELVKLAVSAIADSKTNPFTFNVTYMAGFDFQKLPRKEELERVAHTNCTAIVLPYIRESIADLTRRAGIPPFHIDPVNLIARYEETKKKATAEKIAKKAAKTPKLIAKKLHR
jgi:preprotein translocase subunit SecB